MILILNDIRSVYNVGSIFRTADAAGVEKIILCGYTPTPLDRFGRARQDLAKVALGAERAVPWEYTETLEPLLEELKKEGYTVAALEQDERSRDLFAWQPPQGGKLALILGSEVGGLPRPILDKCDVIVEIPMFGTKESLNVSVSAGIALYTLRHKIDRVCM